MTITFVLYLECSDCGKRYSTRKAHTFCPDCQAALITRYDLTAARRHLDREAVRARPRGMWRWRELLPVEDPAHCVSLGEGDTPILHAPRLGQRLGLMQLYLKDESGNPTGSFKARGLAAAISKAKELGIEKVIIPTAGNAGGAMAAYAARAGIRAHIFMPKDTPSANIKESRMAGAEVVLIDGLISEAAGMAGEKARAEGWFDLSTFKEPYRLEGKKVMGYEIAEFFDYKDLPDVILYPTGGGTGLVGIWKALDELAKLGWLETDKRPRMVAVQAEGCAPVVKAFHEGKDFCDFWLNAQTMASGLRVPKSFADRLILSTLRESKGTAVAVSDEAIFAAQNEIAKQEGLFVAPEGAATLAALKELLRQKWIAPEERVLLLNTGSGLKYLDRMEEKSKSDW
ncbi:MAG TPA: threonine synthase [Anaerolineales bacterium]|nr:threonine synthase [Anaerolineales bacterium]